MDILTTYMDAGALGEITVLVDYEYSPGTPDVMYMPNGDPGYPGEPAEIIINNIYSIKYKFNVDLYEFDPEEYDKLLDRIEEAEREYYENYEE